MMVMSMTAKALLNCGWYLCLNCLCTITCNSPQDLYSNFMRPTLVKRYFNGASWHNIIMQQDFCHFSIFFSSCFTSGVHRARTFVYEYITIRIIHSLTAYNFYQFQKVEWNKLVRVVIEAVRICACGQQSKSLSNEPSLRPKTPHFQFTIYGSGRIFTNSSSF